MSSLSSTKIFCSYCTNATQNGTDFSINWPTPIVNVGGAIVLVGGNSFSILHAGNYAINISTYSQAVTPSGQSFIYPYINGIQTPQVVMSGGGRLPAVAQGSSVSFIQQFAVNDNLTFVLADTGTLYNACITIEYLDLI